MPHLIVPEKKSSEDLQIGPPLDKISGDSHKNGINYAIKTFIYSKNGPFNFIQIRPDHSIDYYIFCGNNLWEGDVGQAYILKIPLGDLYKLIPQYGDYIHSWYIFKIRKNCRK